MFVFHSPLPPPGHPVTQDRDNDQGAHRRGLEPSAGADGRGQSSLLSLHEQKRPGRLATETCLPHLAVSQVSCHTCHYQKHQTSDF